MEKDELFTREAAGNRDFKFDGDTVRVFDDMVGRSVPFYHEIQRMTAEMAADFAQDDSQIWDLGCSTATTILELDRTVDAQVRFVGVDNSEEMLGRARQKLAGETLRHPVELRYGDLHGDLHLENASVVLMVLTLQFVRPLHRSRLLRSIYESLRPQGCLILVEKLTVADSLLNRLYIKHYYEMKRRNGYSDMEISQKREALENVLIPYRMEENRELLTSEGFRHCEEYFRWYNFAGMIAVK